MSPRKRRFNTHLAFFVVFAGLLSCCSNSGANAEQHGACPDYAEYNSVLDGGIRDLRNSSPANLLPPKPSGSEDRMRGIKYGDHSRGVAYVSNFGRRVFVDRYKDHKEPTLQCTMDTAANKERDDELVSARQWWSDIVSELKEKPEYKSIYARSLSRLGDVDLLMSRSDLSVHVDEGPFRSTYEPSSAAAVKNPLSQRDLKIPEMDRGSAFKLQNILEQLPQKRLDSPLNSQNNSEACIRRAIQNYRDALAVERLPEDTMYRAFDYVKLGALEEYLGEMDSANARYLQSANLLVSKPNSDEWVESHELFLNQIPISFMTKKLFGAVSTEDSRVPLESVENEMERYFSALWVSPAMELLSSNNDHANVIRLYKKYANDLLVINDVAIGPESNTQVESTKLASLDIYDLHEQSKSRVRIVNSLIKVGEPALASDYCSRWLSSMPIDKIAAAFSEVALAEVQLKLGAKQEFFASLQRATMSIKQARADNEPSARAKLLLCSRILEDLKTNNNKAMILEVTDLKNEASHRIMQLECITLAKRLSETGRKLERLGNYEASGKMYLAASDIKEKNLGETDIETTEQQIDAGRVLSLSGEHKAAAHQLGRATIGVLGMKTPDTDLIRSTMERYADELSKSGQTELADKVYAELRILPDQVLKPQAENLIQRLQKDPPH